MSERTSIGEKRLEHIDLATKAFEAGDVGATERYIQGFLFYIKEDSLLSKEITKKFDEIEQTRNNSWEKHMEDTKTLDTWTQTDTRSEAKVYLIYCQTRDRLAACTNLSLTHGAFND